MATIRSLLRDRVTLQVRSVDRLFLQAYVPKLMSEGLLIRFLLDRGFPIPSPVLLGRIGARYVRAIERFAGVAQERARVWAGWRQGGSDAHPHFAFGWQSRVPNGSARISVYLTGSSDGVGTIAA